MNTLVFPFSNLLHDGEKFCDKFHDENGTQTVPK